MAKNYLLYLATDIKEKHMRYSKWVGLLAGIIIILGCFMPWLVIDYNGLEISGMHTEGTKYGKPGLFHLIFTSCFIVFNLIDKVWAKRVNLIFVFLNLAWAIRNFTMLGVCYAGECPERQSGLYFVFFASLLIVATALFPDMKVKEKKD